MIQQRSGTRATCFNIGEALHQIQGEVSIKCYLSYIPFNPKSHGSPKIKIIKHRDIDSDQPVRTVRANPVDICY